MNHNQTNGSSQDVSKKRKRKRSKGSKVKNHESISQEVVQELVHSQNKKIKFSDDNEAATLDILGENLRSITQTRLLKPRPLY